MFARCSSSILNCENIRLVRIFYQSSKAALSRREKEEIQIERQKRLQGNAKVSSRIIGQLKKWIKFLEVESSAIQNETIEMTKRFHSKWPEPSLSVLNAWHGAPEGVFVEFSLQKLDSDNDERYIAAFSSVFKNGSHVILKSRKGPTTDIPAVILYLSHGKLKVVIKDHQLGPNIFRFNSTWILSIAEINIFERLLEMFKGANLVEYPGYGLLLKSFKIGTVNRILRDRTKNLEIKKEFDESQKKAIYAAINSKRNFVAIHGPPGTGKTKVIAEIVYQCLERNERIVVCAPSNKAVDNALIACLRRGIDEKICTRLGLSKMNENLSSTHFASMFRQHTFYESLVDYWDRREKFNETKIEDFQKFGDIISRSVKLEKFINRSLIRDVQVVFCTVTNGSLHWLVEQDLFNPDLIILDEAGQVVEPISWQILLLGQRFVVVGDHHQLDSIILSKEKVSLNDVSTSLIQRLMADFENKKGYLHTLNVNYRSNELIQLWSNRHFYGEKLVASDEAREIHINQITRNDSNNSSIQLIDDPLVLLDTADIDKEELLELQIKYPNLSAICFFDSRPTISSSFYNLGEAICATHQILALRQAGLQPSEIGCITPYALQTEKIKKILAANSNDSLDVSSVDAFQGQQREAIVMSFVRNNNLEQIGFLKNLRRMNVAITRAKRQFFLIASSKVLKRNEGLNDLYNIVLKEGRVIRPGDLLLDNSIDIKIPKTITDDIKRKEC
ncbi:hypothetical protein ACQ4LE_003971 [Meloidogyne hapla]